MKKVLELLERYVQVIAVVLGALFAAFMGYRYFVEKTPKVVIGGEELKAGEVDPKIAEGPASSLEQKINGPAPVEKIPVPSLGEGVMKTIKTTPTTQPLAMSWTDSRPVSIDVPDSGPIVEVPQFDPNNPNAPVASDKAIGPVKELAALPAPSVVGATMGLSEVNASAPLLGAREAATQVIPVAQPETVPTAGPGRPGAAPAQPTPPPAAAMPGVQTADKNWVTVSFQIPTDQIGSAMTAARVPQGLMTSFMRVEVEREEMTGPGQWGNRTVVRPLAASQVATHPLPSAGNNAQELLYKQWADSAQVEILQPGFYAILGGSAWKPAEVPGMTPVQGQPQFDPKQYLKGAIPSTLSPEERAAVMKARSDFAREEEQKKRSQRKTAPANGGGMEGDPGLGGGAPPMGPRGGGGGGRGRGRGGFAPTPPELLTLGGPVSPVMSAGLVSMVEGMQWSFGGGEPVAMEMAMQYQGRPMGRPMQRGMDLGLGDVPPDAGDGMNPGGPGAPPAPNMGTVPGGPFDPLTWTNGNIITFAHDENVTPDKTYRYRARYRLANPIYGQPNLAGAQGLASQFLWASNWSDWTSDVAVPPKVNFFVASKLSGSTTASFEVYAFINGQRKMKLVNVAPGDPIGAADATGDYSTGYVLVDTRRDPKENYALVMSPDGTVVRRDHTTDVGSQRYQDIKKSMAPAPGTPGAPSAGARGPGMEGAAY